MLKIEHAQASVGQCVADQGTDRHFWIRIVCNAPGGNPFWT